MRTKSSKLLTLDAKSVIVGFCSGVPTGLIIVLILYAPFDGDLLDRALNSHHSSSSRIGNEYNIRFEQQREDLVREVAANLTGRYSLDRTDPCNQSTSAVATPAPEVVIYKERVIKEWELPALKNISHDEATGETKFGEVPTRFVPLGTGDFLFVKFAAYRFGPSSFSVIGLGAKSMQISWKPPLFDCSWESPSGETENGTARKYLLADTEMPGPRYVAVVVHCSFDWEVGTDGGGGQLKMVANRGEDDHSGLESVSFVALTEKASEYDAALFEAPFKYDYLYCGSPLFAEQNTVSLSPQRIREWVAHHMMLFGPRSHFIFYDTGGINEEVLKILEPWLNLGRLTIMNIRQQQRYLSITHNQLVMLNDCMYRAKTLAPWAFFFDVDEFLNIPPEPMTFPEALHAESEEGKEAVAEQHQLSFDEVMSSLAKRGRRATSVLFQQRPMDDTHCVAHNETPTELQSKWTMEKLVYRRNVLRDGHGHWRNHKYAVQPQHALAIWIHDATHVVVPNGLRKEDTVTHMWMTSEDCSNCIEGDILHYYHYHNTINIRKEVCREFVDPSVRSIQVVGRNKGTWEFDDTMALYRASAVKAFELQMVGSQPTII